MSKQTQPHREACPSFVARPGRRVRADIAVAMIIGAFAVPADAEQTKVKPSNAVELIVPDQLNDNSRLRAPLLLREAGADRDNHSTPTARHVASGS
jgi:hypothetical protein